MRYLSAMEMHWQNLLTMRIKKEYIILVRGGEMMTFRQIEKIIKADGWYQIKSNGGSHRQYKHKDKKGKVTIQYHSKGDIP